MLKSRVKQNNAMKQKTEIITVAVEMEVTYDPTRKGALRCPVCAWCLYDGWIGQNPDCECSGEDKRPVAVRMTNAEATAFISAMSNVHFGEPTKPATPTSDPAKNCDA